MEHDEIDPKVLEESRRIREQVWASRQAVKKKSQKRQEPTGRTPAQHQHMRAMGEAGGRIGGKSQSEAKVDAAKANLEKARESRSLLKDAKHRAHREAQRRYRERKKAQQ